MAESALLVIGLRLALRALPYRIVRQLLAAVGAVRASRGVTVRQVAVAIDASVRHLPGTSSCLVRALAAQTLLQRHGHPARLHIGGAKGESGPLPAHAWVESEGEVVVGGGDIDHYARLEAP